MGASTPTRRRRWRQYLQQFSDRCSRPSSVLCPSFFVRSSSLVLGALTPVDQERGTKNGPGTKNEARRTAGYIEMENALAPKRAGAVDGRATTRDIQHGIVWRLNTGYPLCENGLMSPVASIEALLAAFFVKLDDPGVISAYLFGSHAEERAHRESDIDVAVLLDRKDYPDEKD